MIVRRAAILAVWLGLLGAASALAAPAAAPSAQGKRAFLSVPVWYLDYDVDIELSGMGGKGDTHVHSHTSPRILLDLRNQGPLLLMDRSGGVASMLVQIDDAANWMVGPPFDADGNGDISPAEMNARLDSSMALQKLEYSHNSVNSHDTARGAGRLHPVDDTYHFEVDVTKGKFAVLLPVTFSDLPLTATSVRGEAKRMEARNDGTTYWEVKPIEEPFSMGMPDYQTDPPAEKPGLIVGTLPAQLSAISGSVSYAIAAGPGLTGKLTIQFTASPFPPKPIELVIKVPDDYGRWRPLGTRLELEPGNTIQVEAVLRGPGGGPPPFKASRITWELLGTSREPGVCMNWPPDPHVPPWPDLKIERDYNSTLLTDSATEWQKASDTGTDLTESVVTISCFDFGAHAGLQVTAELTNGDVVVGVVEGTADRSLRLPARPLASIVADAYKKHYGAEGQADAADLDDDPVCDGFPGDGLTLYEEYRGFWVGGEWLETDPWTRDVFIQNTMRSHGSTWNGIRYYRRATHLAVHDLLEDEEVRGDHVINFRRASSPHVVDQHAIYIVAKDDPNEAFANVEVVGTPGTSRAVHMPPGWRTFHRVSRDLDGDKLGYFAVTLAHEMLHASNVYHHGQADEDVTWTLKHRLLDRTPYIVESSLAGDAEVSVRTEQGREIGADSLFFAGAPTMEVWLGVDEGQHSGAWDCLMRYDVAVAYRSRRQPTLVRYFACDEPAGEVLCSNIVGTGVNQAGRAPQSRYVNAAAPDPAHEIYAQRGRCDHQIRISDVGTEPKR